MNIPYAEVIGDPVAHSKSPLIHKFWLGKLGMEGDFRATRVGTDALAAHLELRRNDPGWLGCSVTLPHKQSVLDLLDEVDSVARGIGAVNCIARGGGWGEHLAGRNTDWTGFLEPLGPYLDRRHVLRLAYVIGTGGAALAVSYALDRAGFTVVSVGRDREKAMALQRRLGFFDESMALELQGFETAGRVDWDDRTGVLDLLVNATPLGMAGYPGLPLNLDRLPRGGIVYDLVYNPVETPLIKRARESGRRTIGGLAMLIGQAATAFETFFSEPPPRVHDEELRELLTR